MQEEALMQHSFYRRMHLGKQWLLSWTVYSGLGTTIHRLSQCAHTRVCKSYRNILNAGRPGAHTTIKAHWHGAATVTSAHNYTTGYTWKGHRSLVTSCTKFEEEKEIKVMFGHKLTLINCDFFTRLLRIHGSRRPLTCTFIIFASWQNRHELSLPSIEWLLSHSWTWASPLLASLMPGAAARDSGIFSRQAEFHQSSCDMSYNKAGPEDSAWFCCSFSYSL